MTSMEAEYKDKDVLLVSLEKEEEVCILMYHIYYPNTASIILFYMTCTHTIRCICFTRYTQAFAAHKKENVKLKGKVSELEDKIKRQELYMKSRLGKEHKQSNGTVVVQGSTNDTDVPSLPPYRDDLTASKLSTDVHIDQENQTNGVNNNKYTASTTGSTVSVAGSKMPSKGTGADVARGTVASESRSHSVLRSLMNRI